MKKINSYYKPSHNGKSKIYHEPTRRKKSNQCKINKQTNRQANKQLKIKNLKKNFLDQFHMIMR
ncbi:hypothetical protein c7_R1320 [Megavirus courdo7]|uniref:Uncharacterized protein n=1 Tax=Megavirus courdo7 TaxID=1128135 RepID=H2ECQ9_9VIRU|nr:hypothetical protein c7_R1320 [Megavirus courdo7]